MSIKNQIEQILKNNTDAIASKLADAGIENPRLATENLISQAMGELGDLPDAAEAAVMILTPDDFGVSIPKATTMPTSPAFPGVTGSLESSLKAEYKRRKDSLRADFDVKLGQLEDDYAAIRRFLG